jgi:hypothetical protein
MNVLFFGITQVKIRDNNHEDFPDVKPFKSEKNSMYLPVSGKMTILMMAPG